MRKRKILLFALCLTLGCSLTACKRDRSEFEREDYMKNQEADKEQAAKLSGRQNLQSRNRQQKKRHLSLKPMHRHRIRKLILKSQRMTRKRIVKKHQTTVIHQKKTVINIIMMAMVVMVVMILVTEMILATVTVTAMATEVDPAIKRDQTTMMKIWMLRI